MDDLLFTPIWVFGWGPMAEAVGAIRINPRWPLGLGAVFIMLGAGVSLALWLSPEHDPHNAWPVGLVAVSFGIGLPLLPDPAGGPLSRPPRGSTSRHERRGGRLGIPGDP
jgi:hypothetical protein